MTSAPKVEELQARSPTRFLVELENACAALRLYGASHPAFARNAAQAAAALTAPLSFSISSHGFVPTDATMPQEASAGGAASRSEPTPEGAELAQRLRALGLIGLRAQPQLAGAQVEAFVRVLCEAEREHLPASAVEQRIWAASGQRIKVIPLRLDSLHFVHGSSGATDGRNRAALWRDLFHQACGVGGRAASATPANAAGLAIAFESAAQSVQEPGDWREIVENWQQSLCDIKEGATRDSAGISQQRLELVSGFLQKLDPSLRQRLLAETLSAQNVPQPVVLELAGRLPEGMILDALAALGRDDRQPSSAALALLRKVSAGIKRTAGNDVPTTPSSRIASALTTQTGANPWRSTVPDCADSADFATTIQQLLGSRQEESFVPADYLRRRQELSATELAPRVGFGPIHGASEQETARHAAALVLRMLSAADSRPEHLTAALCFLKDRMVQWVRAGWLDLAGDALSAAQPLGADPDAGVATSARSLIEELVQSMSQKPRQFIGTLLASAAEAQALKFIEQMLPLTPPLQRRELLEALFARNIRWPLPLTESLLKDASPVVRRLAVMRLTRDHDLTTAASFFCAASQGHGFEVDVAQGLAELLRPSLAHPDVRSAFKAWRWSRRRWAALLFPTLSGRRDAE